MNNQTKNMKTKKLILSIFLLAFTFFTQNIKAQTTIGGGVAYGTEIENMGIDLTGQYFIKDNLAIEASFVYYFPKDFGTDLSINGEDFKIKWYEINANANYYFNMDGNIKAYALGGLNMSIVSIPTFDFGSIFGGGGSGVKNISSSKIGLNIGGGADFDLGKNITPFAQLKYVLSDFDQLQILAGVRFNL